MTEPTPNFVQRAACPVCGSAEASAIYSAPYDADPVRALIDSHYREQGHVDWSLLAGATYVVAACPVCDLIFQQMVPSDPVLERVYSQMISPAFLEPFENGLITLDSVAKITGELAHLFRLTGKPPGEITFLDYGFGQGRWGRVAKGMGARVFGVEMGEDKKVLAASLGIEILDDAAIDHMRFDIVHTEQVLEHLVHPGRDFARLARATEVLFKAAVPVRGDLRGLLARHGLPEVSAFARARSGQRPHRHDEAFSAIQPLEHLNAYSRRTMEWLGAQNGLEIASRSRLGAVTVEIAPPGQIPRSLARLARMAVKAVLPFDQGYYLYRRR